MGVLTFDTVGILVGEGWSPPEDIILIWQYKRYRCWLQVEDEDWCPGWIDKPEKIQTAVHNLVSSDEEGHESPVQNEVEQPNQIGGDQSRVQGESEQLCRGIGEEIDGGPASKEKKSTNKVYYFGSNGNSQSSAQDLNSQQVSSPQEELGNSSCDGGLHTSGEQMAEHGDIRIDNIRMAEVEATILIGKELGVNLDNF
ncbi:hypothetical protein L1987_01426 [Smallanthus sonchifolius]|uniref:Uncharacterized protein n=1 Tax=Smallanthus sonchifolius TaxID=185202 RepID=A0ACB9K527_9ASTR|nr:hypothetical protein L1987_01426 [Smallanthus sonchifolius]